MNTESVRDIMTEAAELMAALSGEEEKAESLEAQAKAQREKVEKVKIKLGALMLKLVSPVNDLLMEADDLNDQIKRTESAFRSFTDELDQSGVDSEIITNFAQDAKLEYEPPTEKESTKEIAA